MSDAISIATTWNFEGLNVESIQRTTSRYSIGKNVGKCKLCDGDIVDKGEFYGCTNYKQTTCNFTISKKILSKKISQTNIQKLLKWDQTNLIKGFKKGDKTFDAKLDWKEGKIQFIFESAHTKN